MKITEVTAGVQYRIYAPSAFKSSTLDAFASLIYSSGETNNRNIRRNLRRAHAIAFARIDGVPIGVAVVKNPIATYIPKVFEAAGVPELAAHFKLELGYVNVDPQYRGQNISKVLMDMIKHLGVPMYATTRGANSAMQHILQSNGFTPTGNPFKGESGSDLTLWTKQ